MYDFISDNPYFLLTPGPLSTSKGVRNAMLRDRCTWDDDYNKDIVQNIRTRLIALATNNTEDYSVVLMQGSGSFSAEACLGSAIPLDGEILIITNGAYGKRMVQIADILKLNYVELAYSETTTGILNPLAEIAAVVKEYGKNLHCRCHEFFWRHSQWMFSSWELIFSSARPTSAYRAFRDSRS